MLVNVKFNGVLKSAGIAKIQRFDNFSKCKSRGGGYRVSHGSPLKCPVLVEHVCTGVTYVTLKYIAPVIGTNGGGRIQNFKVFGLLRDY